MIFQKPISLLVSLGTQYVNSTAILAKMGAETPRRNFESQTCAELGSYSNTINWKLQTNEDESSSTARYLSENFKWNKC